MTINTADRTSRRWSILAAAAVLAVLPATGHTQAAPASSTGQDAKRIVSQPVRDVGIEKTRIPPLLLETSEDPYSMKGSASCRQIAAGIGALTGVLGADFSELPSKNRNLARSGGEAVVNSLIPFRGLVREASGAGPAERRLDAAIKAGFARRGFLRGLQRARACRG